jgi:hypothetical protein
LARPDPAHFNSSPAERHAFVIGEPEQHAIRRMSFAVERRERKNSSASCAYRKLNPGILVVQSS